jgi:polar amino acid transport system substrate-binding protein
MPHDSFTMVDFVKKRPAAALLCVILAVFFGASCSKDKASSGKILVHINQLNTSEYSIGVPQGAAAMGVVEKGFPKCRIEYFGSLNDGYLAVKHKKIDAFAFDRPILQYVVSQNPDLAIMDEKIASEEIVVGLSLGNTDLMEKVNAFIAQYRADGTYKAMYERWLLEKEPKMPDLGEVQNPLSTIRVGTEGLAEPMNYFKDGRLTGFDIEFARRLGQFMHARVEFVTMEYSALVIAASTGKIDLLVAGLNATPERRKKVLFSNTYIDSDIALLVRKDRLPVKAEQNQINDFPQLAGKRVGILTGSSFDGLLQKKIPEAIPEYFNNYPDQAAALQAGKIAGFLIDEPVIRDIESKASGVTHIKKVLSPDNYAFAFSKNQPDLYKQADAVLKEMWRNGEIRKINDKWFGSDEKAKVMPDLTPGTTSSGSSRTIAGDSSGNPKGVSAIIRFAINSGAPPFSYISDGKIVGYDVEIAATIADRLGKRLEIVDMDFGAIILALIQGKVDMAGGCISITEERAKSVFFTTPTYAAGVYVMVADGGSAPRSAYFAGLLESFRRTFIVEARYKLVASGLGVTIIITLLSAFIGTVIGFVVCLARRSATRMLAIPAKVFIRAIQGTPIVVLLMILYYIVFGNVEINTILVAIIGFSINFAAYVSEMMRTGIDAVEKGQLEAASAMGFSKLQVFGKIVFPQAARHVLPVFKGEFISMLKMTSVVGYIAIQDLTKMSDIIRSRTYEAFFPLIATAVIYFVVAYVMISILALIEVRIDPKRRKRTIRGLAAP